MKKFCDDRSVLFKILIFSCAVFFNFLAGCDKLSIPPCQIEVKGICYDKPKASNPPLTASWQIIDIDTKKPIPGVWISFYWKKFPDGQQSGSCARNVMGQTDANGRFSNTAEDGSWMFTEVFMFKPGFQRIRYQRLLEQTYVTDKYDISQEFVGKYPGWETELKAMGYRLDTTSTTNNYYKNFELGADYLSIMSAAWQPEGERQYWVSKRGIPDGREISSLGIYTCYSRALGKTDPNAEFIGYQGPEYDQNSVWNREKAMDAYHVICDEKWDSVPNEFEWTSTPSYYNSAIEIIPNLDTKALDSLLANYLAGLRSSNSRPLTKIERKAFCEYLAPFAEKESK